MKERLLPRHILAGVQLDLRHADLQIEGRITAIIRTGLKDADAAEAERMIVKGIERATAARK